MIKKISYIIFSFLNFLDKILKLITKRSFLIWFKDFLEKDSYKKIKLDNDKTELEFFTPNYLTNWLVNDFYSKEPETLDWIRNFEKKEKKIIFWDIGANIGLYSIFAAKIHKNIKVISFEPSTNNLRILSRNIFINNLVNKIKIFQLPLGDKPNNFSNFSESLFLEGASHNSFDHDLDFEGKNIKITNNYKILGTTIKNIIEQKILELPDYIKIDVDGIEHLILKGAGNVLSNENIKSIQIEINEKYQEQYKSILNFMRENGFILKNKKRNENLLIYRDPKFSETFNYFFVKKL
jgi:FkbM family methyltransferase